MICIFQDMDGQGTHIYVGDKYRYYITSTISSSSDSQGQGKRKEKVTQIQMDSLTPQEIQALLIDTFGMKAMDRETVEKAVRGTVQDKEGGEEVVKETMQRY